MTASYDDWLGEVSRALESVNMTMREWQRMWAFDFRREFDSGTSANDAATKANQFWWHRQNTAIGQNCLKTQNCWLPRNHQGECQPRT
jgi:hypothetical protein